MSKEIRASSVDSDGGLQSNLTDIMQNYIRKQDNDREVARNRTSKVKTLNNYNRLNFNLQTLFNTGQNQRFKTMKEEDWVKKETKE